MQINFSQLANEQKQTLLQHLEKYASNPELMDGSSKERLNRISSEIRDGGTITDHTDTHMLAIYIANTYAGADGSAWYEYLSSLGLPEDLF